MKIDLHVHCSEFSPCGRSPGEQVIESAIRKGLDALVFTNHFQFVPQGQLEMWNGRYAPFRILNGIEVHADEDDFIVLGVLDDALTSNSWRYERLHPFVRERDGYLILAHPFRYHEAFAMDLESLPPDAIECRSSNILPEHCERIIQLAQRLKAPIVCASDAHSLEKVGMWHIEFATMPQTERELVEALRAGTFTCGPLGEQPAENAR